MAIINNTAMKNTETLYKYAKCGLFFQLLPESYCIYKKGKKLHWDVDAEGQDGLNGWLSDNWPAHHHALEIQTYTSSKLQIYSKFIRESHTCAHQGPVIVCMANKSLGIRVRKKNAKIWEEAVCSILLGLPFVMSSNTFYLVTTQGNTLLKCTSYTHQTVKYSDKSFWRRWRRNHSHLSRVIFWLRK